MACGRPVAVLSALVPTRYGGKTATPNFGCRSLKKADSRARGLILLGSPTFSSNSNVLPGRFVTDTRQNIGSGSEANSTPRFYTLFLRDRKKKYLLSPSLLSDLFGRVVDEREGSIIRHNITGIMLRHGKRKSLVASSQSWKRSAVTILHIFCCCLVAPSEREEPDKCRINPTAASREF